MKKILYWLDQHCLYTLEINPWIRRISFSLCKPFIGYQNQITAHLFSFQLRHTSDKNQKPLYKRNEKKVFGFILNWQYQEITFEACRKVKCEILISFTFIEFPLLEVQVVTKCLSLWEWNSFSLMFQQFFFLLFNVCLLLILFYLLFLSVRSWTKEAKKIQKWNEIK